MARELYRSSDYSGVTTKDGKRFYYGYEHTTCTKHGDDSQDKCEESGCEKSDWCFVVTDKKGKEIWRCSTKTLERSFRTLDGAGDMGAFLVAGIILYQENRGCL